MDPSISIGQIISLYQGKVPKEAQTVLSVFRIACPELERLKPHELKAWCNETPISVLFDKLNEEGPGWAPSVEQDLIQRGFTSSTYLKNYPRVLKRFLDFAETLGLDYQKKDMIPEWHHLTGYLYTVIPKDRATLHRYVKAGVQTIAGYNIQDKPLKMVDARFQNLRYHFRCFAMSASSRKLTPQAITEKYLIPEDLEDLVAFAPKEIGYSFCRNTWNLLVESFPELGLALWPTRTVEISLPVADWPENVRIGVEEAVFHGKRLKESTKKTYQNTITAYFGLLEKEGISLQSLVAGLTPNDAVRVLFQAFPRELLSGDSTQDHPRALCRRMLKGN